LDFSFTKADRLLKRNEFIQLSKVGRKLQNNHFIAIYASGRLDRCRLGITVTRKVGRAVKRNRIKRLIREYFRCHRHLISGKWDINVIVKKEAADLSSEELFGSLQNIFERISRRVEL
jgi:ribonuclease P protein component